MGRDETTKYLVYKRHEGCRGDHSDHVHEPRSTTINGVAFKFHVDFDPVTQQSTLSRIFRNGYNSVNYAIIL